MNKHQKLLFSIIFAVCAGFALTGAVSAQNVNVSPNAATYPTLAAALAAVNSGTHTGAVTVNIVNNTTEPATGAVLNASGSGAANYTSLLITASGARTVLGTTNTGTPLVDLNGAGNVTVNGTANGGTLTLTNGSTDTAAGSSTIRFINDATGNTVTNTTILGATQAVTNTAPANTATILFSTAAAGGAGNSSNTVSNCNIGPFSAATLPAAAITSTGSTTSSAVYNRGNIITGNNIFDFFSQTTQSNGVYLGADNSTWTIGNNRFYQTAARTQTTGALHSPIQVNGTGNDGHLISGNIIGFANSAGTGTYNFVGASNTSRFAAINITAATNTAATAISIQGNTITAINISGTIGGASTGSSFIGIVFAPSGGTTFGNIGNTTGNIIGSLTAAGAITITNANTLSTEVRGIYYFPLTATNVSNNNVGGITYTNTGATTTAQNVIGIDAYTNGGVATVTTNNIVGSAAAPIQLNTTSTGISTVTGLQCRSGTCTTTGNTITNLTSNAPNTTAGTSASVIGLIINSASVNSVISQNTIHSLSNTTATAAVSVFGILSSVSSTAGNTIIGRNFIHSLSTATSGAGVLRGINVTGGTANYQNNMIRLGVDAAGNSVSGGYDIIGISETTGTNNYYFNSVYIGGSSGTTTVNSFAFSSSVVNNTRNFKNNIFANNRSLAGGGGTNAAAQYAGTLPNPAGLSSDYNVYFSQDPNTIIRNNATNYSLAAWRTASGGQDANSKQASNIADVGFVTPDGTAGTVNLHINSTSIANNAGTPVTSITDDFDGQTRSTTTPDIGADEFTAPTAASVTISGRVFAGKGRGLVNATVYLTDSRGETRAARTSTFGYYRFDDVAVGQTVVVTVVSKRYQFTPQVFSITEELTNLDFNISQWQLFNSERDIRKTGEN